MTIDPRIPTMSGRSTSGFHQPGRHCLNQARSAVRCWASRMKGELHPSKNRWQEGLRHLVPTFLLTDDSANELYFVFWCDHSRDSNKHTYRKLFAESARLVHPWHFRGSHFDTASVHYLRNGSAFLWFLALPYYFCFCSFCQLFLDFSAAS